MGKRFFLLCCMLLAEGLAAQNATPNYSKVHFVYERKPNYHVDEKGVYADTLLLQVSFPKIKYIKTLSPLDSKKVVGFASLEKFSSDEKKELASALYHTAELIKGTHDFQKNTTRLDISREDEDTKKIITSYLNGGYSKFRYSITIDYNKKTVLKKFPRVSYDQKFDTELRTIQFSPDNPLSGYYTEKTKTLQLDNFVLLKEGLSAKVVPDVVFSNNEFGVAKIITIHETITLKSVAFE